MHHLHDPPSDALLRFAHSCSFAALSRRPSLRSARGCATPWLRHATQTASFAPLSLSRLVSRTQRAGGGGLKKRRKGRITHVQAGS